MRKKRKVYSCIFKDKGLSAAEEEECILQNTAEACFCTTCTCLSHMLTKAANEHSSATKDCLGRASRCESFQKQIDENGSRSRTAASLGRTGWDCHETTAGET